MLLVFAIILAALVLFATEPVPIDITAIGVMVVLMVLGDWTAITPADGLSGFSSTATITVLAMFILSAGVQQTGVIQLLGQRIAAITRGSETKNLAATITVVGPISGFVNNTAAVAILLPMVTDLAEESRISPSKLLIPLSYASMFGGMLTLIGTSTNILASSVTGELAAEYPGLGLHEFSMFEFTHLGAIVTVVGFVYLLTVGRRLIPARIPPPADLTEEFRMADYLTEVRVREDSPLVDRTVEEVLEETDFDADILQLIRGTRAFLEPLARKVVQPGDIFLVRTDRATLVDLLDVDGLDLVPDVQPTEADLEQPEPEGENLVEIVVAPGASLVGETLASAAFRNRYDTTVLALRRGDELIRQRIDQTALRVGDTLLVQGTVDSIERLDANRNFIVAQEIERHDFREEKIPLAVGIVGAVVAVAALTPIPIVVSALAGALLMVVTNCLKPTEIYDAVHWDVIFLLAGVIPLGIALTETGGADFIAALVLMAADFLPTIAVLGLFYLLTALLTNVISNNASVVLMIPVAVEAARGLNANAFAFVLAVTFAASTAFMTPVGYQTNLFVYGPGGYKFTDYLRAGTPLQLVFAVVTTLGIAAFWGLQPA
jgi:di/tricarboxylate transporter